MAYFVDFTATQVDYVLLAYCKCFWAECCLSQSRSLNLWITASVSEGNHKIIILIENILFLIGYFKTKPRENN